MTPPPGEMPSSPSPSSGAAAPAPSSVSGPVVASDRARGLTLYGLTVAVAAAGAIWFFASAPRMGEDPRTIAGRRTVERLVPELPGQSQAETMILATGSRIERNVPVRRGSYVVVVVCTGQDQLRVRLSTTTVDSGRAVPCAREPQPVELSIALSSMFFLSVASEADAETVFRWRLVRSGSL